MRARDVNPYDLNAVAKADRQPRPRDTSWRPLKLQREYDKLLASVKELSVETARALAVPVAELLNRKIAEAEARAKAAEKQLKVECDRNTGLHKHLTERTSQLRSSEQRRGNVLGQIVLLREQLAEARARIEALEETLLQAVGPKGTDLFARQYPAGGEGE